TIATGPRAGQVVPVEVDTHIAGVLKFASGALIQIVTSFDIKGHKHLPLEIYGTTGSMIVPDPNTFVGSVELLDGKDWVEQPLSHGHGDDNYRGIGLADMADDIVNNRPHRASGDLALHVLEVIEALHSSASAGRVVAITSKVERPAPFAPGLKIGEIA
ncbi:MAG: Gfo/Idh/MocA family oxidoreductase, partial [Deltaproteobacteria bacterium]